MNLIVHQGALGDWVLVFPILRALGESDDPRTLAVTAPGKGRLAGRMFPHVRALNAESQEWSRLFAPDVHAECIERLRAQCGPVGRIISFVSTGRDTWAANIVRVFPLARCAFVEPRPPAGWQRHVTEWHREQLSGWPASGATGRPPPGSAGVLTRTATDGAEGGRGRPRSRGPIVIHPGSGGRAKCWPVQRFEELIRRLRHSGREVRPVIGEVEDELFAKDLIARWRRDLGLRCLSGLDELYDVLELAALYIGNDSGPTHLAAQMGRPTVALFGPTDPRVWGPVGPRVIILAPPSPEGMGWLGVEAVLAAVEVGSA